MAEVLIVDDEVALLELLRDVLENIGCDVLCALDGQEALTILSESIEPPMLIITDMMMPVINGLKLIEIVREIPRFTQVPIIMMSMSTAGSKETAPLADEFILKPFNLEAFRVVIERYLDKSDILTRLRLYDL
jgi:CheY-like chemotaxis protein